MSKREVKYSKEKPTVQQNHAAYLENRKQWHHFFPFKKADFESLKCELI